MQRHVVRSRRHAGGYVSNALRGPELQTTLENKPEHVKRLTEYLNMLQSPMDCVRALGLELHPDVAQLKKITHKQAGNIIYHMSMQSQFKDTSKAQAAVKKASRKLEAARAILDKAERVNSAKQSTKPHC